MVMAQVKARMEEAGTGFLATTDGERAAVRPMGGWAWVGGELWCATGLQSDKVEEIRKCPRAEYCFMSGQGQHVRIAGPCVVSTDADDKQKLFDAVQMLRNYVDGPDDPGYAVLRLTAESIRWWTGAATDYAEIRPA